MPVKLRNGGANFLPLLFFLVLAVLLVQTSFALEILSPDQRNIVIRLDDDNGGSGGGEPTGIRPSCVVTSGDLRMDKKNTITADVTDPDGNIIDAYIFIKSPSTKSYYNKAFYDPMSCTGTGFAKTCTFVVEPNSSWGEDATIEVSGIDEYDFGEYCSKIVRVIAPASPTPTPTSQNPTSTPTVTSPNVRPTVRLSLQDLKRYEGNQITASVTDPDGDINILSVLIYVKSPSAEENFRVNGQRMLCSGTAANLSCTYNIRPDSNWGNDALITVVASDKVGKGQEAKQNVLVKPEVIPTPTPSPSPTPTPSPSPSPTPIPTTTPSPSPNQTPALRPTPTPEKTKEISPTQSLQPTNPTSTASGGSEEKDNLVLILLLTFISAAILFIIYYIVRKRS